MLPDQNQPGGQLEQPAPPAVVPLQPLPSTQAAYNPVDYEFITNPPKPKHRWLGGGSSQTSRLLLLAGGLLVIVIIVWAAAALFSPKSNNAVSLTAIAQQQTEISRVAGVALMQPGASQTTRSLAASTSLTIGTDQANLVTFLKKNGIKLSPKQLALRRNLATDAALTAAASAGNFDSAYAATVRTELNAYGNNLSQAYVNSKSPALKSLLSQDYNNAQLLIKQIPAGQ